MTDRPADSCLTLWTIYDRPRDHPDKVVVRGHDVIPKGGVRARAEAALFDNVEAARAWAIKHGLWCLGRMPEDEAQIVESWI